MIIVTPYLVRPVSGQLATADRWLSRAERHPARCSSARRSPARAAPSRRRRSRPPAPRRRRRRPSPLRGSSCDPRLLQEGLRRCVRNSSSSSRSRSAAGGAATRRDLPDSGRCSGQRAGRDQRRLRVRRCRARRRARARRSASGSTAGSRASASATATSIYVDGAYCRPARGQVAQVAGEYGMLVQPGAPVTAGAVQPGTVRVVVSRRRAEVPGCPNWSAAFAAEFRQSQHVELRLRREFGPRRDGRQSRGPDPRSRRRAGRRCDDRRPRRSDVSHLPLTGADRDQAVCKDDQHDRKDSQ